MLMIAVGLIWGTHMWYAMWDAENDDEAAFERWVDSVTREIGERGKLNVPESVPPMREATPTPAPAPARAVAPGVALAPSLAPAPAPALSSTTGAAIDPSPSPTSTLVSQPRGTAAITPNIASSVQEQQQPTAPQQVSSSAHVVASGTGASLMEVSAFMTEQLKAQMVEQRAHDNEQHAEMIRLLVEREAKLEAKLEAQRQEFETKLEAHRRETQGQARTIKVVALQLRFVAGGQRDARDRGARKAECTGVSATNVGSCGCRRRSRWCMGVCDADGEAIGRHRIREDVCAAAASQVCVACGCVHCFQRMCGQNDMIVVYIALFIHYSL
jgi:hypothetical protein